MEAYQQQVVDDLVAVKSRIDTVQQSIGEHEFQPVEHKLVKAHLMALRMLGSAMQARIDFWTNPMQVEAPPQLQQPDPQPNQDTGAST